MRRLATTLFRNDPPAASGGEAGLRSVRPYILALILTALALAATLTLQNIFVQRPSLFPFFAAIAIAAWSGGRGPGAVAAVISLPLGLYFYVAARPDHDLYVRDIFVFVFFALCAFAGGTLYAHRRRTEETLNKAHQDLQKKAAELQHTNDALLAEIAERKRTEAILETTRSELTRSAQLASMAETAASIAHEINQPLTAAVTNAEACVRWLNASSPDIAEAREAAKRIVRDAGRASQVIARIRATVKNALASPVQVSVLASLNDVLAVLQADIQKNGVGIVTDVDPALPDITGDRIQIQQVFVNLITNALDSLKLVSGRARRLHVSARLKDSNMVEIVISDNGLGLADSVLDRLFDSFVTTKSGGMGIGLSICRTIVEAHGGTLTAAQAPDGGAQFIIALPTNGAAHD